jgi:cellulose synthase/poly-beta-1,6-N-acetylglucosamine synthase-like glycosyltransferase
VVPFRRGHNTKFVAFIDDDQCVGPSFLLDCLKLLHVKKSLGVCGVRGGTYKVGSSEWRSVLDTTKDNQYNIVGSGGGSSNLDSLFSSYVMPASWVKLIFRKRLWTMKTGEDITIPYLVRKYAGVPGFIIPKPAGYVEEIYSDEPRS